jgi:uncharacterized protein
MSSVFVLGGTGFIGTEVVKALTSRHDKVYGLARSAASELKLTELGVTPIRGDVYQPAQWLANLPPVDYAINVLGFFNDAMPKRLSVSFAARCHEKYTHWARTLLDLAKKKDIKAVVHVSGTTIYEEGSLDWVTENTPLRYTPHGFNRIARSATRMIVEGINAGLPIIVAVAPNVVYGPVPGSSFEQIFVEPVRKNQMGITGSGTNYIPTGHVVDVGRAVAHVTDAQYAGQFFLIAGDDAITQKEFLRAIADGLGKKSVLQLPKPLVALLGGKVAAEFMSTSQRVNNTKLKHTGFFLKHPRFMDEIMSVVAQLQYHRGSRQMQPAVAASSAAGKLPERTAR